jgi:O-antigen/teichoic acid export membrane protein
MKQIKTLWGRFRRDSTLGRVIKNSGFLLVSNLISAVISIATANLVGVAVFGVLGIITSFITNVNQLLSFRMADVVVRYMGGYYVKKEYDKAAAIVKLAGIAEATISILAYVVLLILAPIGARYIAKDQSLTPLFLIYGLSILAMITFETATGVLRVVNSYFGQSVINLLQSVVTLGIIIYAYITRSGIMVVLMAYLAGKVILGLGTIIFAIIRARQTLGKNWWKASFKLLPPIKELTKFALSTNFSGTINMVVRDSELLWVGGLFSPTVAGYYKVAISIINLIIMPINPFIATTFPEIIRTAANKLWKHLKSLLKRVSFLAALWTGAVTIGLLVIGKQALFTKWIPWRGHLASVYKPEFLPSFPILLILLVGFGVGNILYWNRNLLLAFNRADFPLKISFWGSLIKIALTLTIIPLMVQHNLQSSAILVEAILFTSYLAISTIVLTLKGIHLIPKVEQEPSI